MNEPRPINPETLHDAAPDGKEAHDGLTDLIGEVDGNPSHWRAWLAVGAVAVGAFAFVTTEFLPVGILPQVSTDFGVSPGIAGLMVTIPGFLAAISAPVMMV